MRMTPTRLRHQVLKALGEYSAWAGRPTVLEEAIKTIQQLADELAAARLANAWVPVAKRKPRSGQIVLAHYVNRAGQPRRVRAAWVKANSLEVNVDSDFGQYDEAADTYYAPAGWYEQIDNWPEFTACPVDEGEVTHWTPLPALPKGMVRP